VSPRYVALRKKEFESQKFDLVIIDEVHEFFSSSESDFLLAIGSLQKAGASTIGVTATPFVWDAKSVYRCLHIINSQLVSGMPFDDFEREFISPIRTGSKEGASCVAVEVMLNFFMQKFL
jgi:superfamily II DNA or RNA helicase